MIGQEESRVVLVKDNDKIKPVAIFINYVIPVVGYVYGVYEG
jgi:hypothetical protein